MAVDPFQLKQGDLLPTLARQFQEGDGTPIDLSGASVGFHMRASGAQVAVVATWANVLNATLGQCEYVWAGADTATAGYYEGEFVLTISATGKKRTIPNSTYIPIRILPKLP